MSDALDRVTGALYRVGFHHDDGSATVVSLTAHPVRLAVGELSATAADALENAAGRRRSQAGASRHRPFTAPGEVGPSTF